MDKHYKIPKGCFAADDEEARLKQKREELKYKLLKGKVIPLPNSIIYLPQEIEIAGLSGILYGLREYNICYVTSNQEKKENEIGRIFETKPKQNLSEGITGYYENGVLKFENPDGSECVKRTYGLFEKWMLGEIDIIYNHPEISIPPCRGFIPGL